MSTTNPEGDLFAAGYAACFHGAVKRVAGDHKVSIGKSTVDAHVAIGPGESGPVSCSPPGYVRR